MKKLLLTASLVTLSVLGMAQGHLLSFERTLNSPEGKIGLNLLSVHMPVQVYPDRIYYWLKSHEIHESQGDYAGQLLNGNYIRFDASNNLLEKGIFANGLKHGAWKTWHANGHLATMGSWVQGRLQGTYREYDEDGKLRRQAHYRKGQLHGKVSTWTDGVLMQTLRFRKGIELPEKQEKIKSDQPKEKREKSPKTKKAPKVKSEQETGPFDWIRNPFRKKNKPATKPAKKTPETPKIKDQEAAKSSSKFFLQRWFSGTDQAKS